jgi:hypothetical protein
MVRRFLYIVLAVIALQLSWTAVSAYCMHEAGLAARHFGHHQHADHDADHAEQADQANGQAVKDPTGTAKKFAAHAHCASCSHAVLAIDLHHASTHPLTISTAPSGDLPYYSSIATAPPERPQWSAAA